MNETLSFWKLILGASLVVQIVMFVLVVISVISWMIIFYKLHFFRKIERHIEQFDELFWSGIDIAKLHKQLVVENSVNLATKKIFFEGFKEFNRLHKIIKNDPESILFGVEKNTESVIATEEIKFNDGLSALATIASVSPYIGLFGTVWGIMNSFIGLSSTTQATLNVVAPGIAEALIATAIGLIVAIPAVIFFNIFSAKCEKILKNCDIFAEEFKMILYRAIHQQATQQQK